MIDPSVFMSRNAAKDLDAAVEAIAPDKVFVLYDTQTRQMCKPALASSKAVAQASEIVIGNSDTNKNIDTLCHVWEELSNGGATRHSLLVNVGGGMVSDLGGFAASTFKRGIAYINIPTTLLAMVDASVGGKTAINFNGLKNEVGVFSAPKRVIVCTDFLNTLDIRNLLSGYAEMIKHGLISNAKNWAELMNFSFNDSSMSLLHDMIATSIDVKANIVVKDPKEKGLRRVLNLGHTVGHAFESFALARKRPVLHGYAVAWGLAAESYLARTKAGFPADIAMQTIGYIREHYGSFDFSCDDCDRLYEIMTHDKKNTGQAVSFVLLSDIGKPKLNCTASKDEIKAMLEFYKDSMD